ncbi:MAG: hypothetical protein HC875_40145 [Anaerolineales bacterium]|nr:hypothetical protein [Anaerolineales bacterium]
MKRFTIAIMMTVFTLGLTFMFYAKPVEVPVQKDVWNRAGSGFELSSLRDDSPSLNPNRGLEPRRQRLRTEQRQGFRSSLGSNICLEPFWQRL